MSWFDSITDLANDVGRIVVAPVRIVADLTSAAIKPIADVAEDVADTIRDAVKDD